MMYDLPEVGLGTWGMGGKYERDESNYEESIEAVRQALAIGYRLIDVAELYGQGLTEEIVGQAIKGFDRSQLRLMSKVWKTNLLYDDVLRAAEGSLKRLGVDYLDHYLIHWPNPEISLKSTMRALERLVDEGLARSIGVSNFVDVALLEEAQSYLDHTPLAVNQIEYSLVARSAEKAIIPYCQSHNIQIVAYRPLMRGMLTSGDNIRIYELTEKYHKTKAQIALNWLITQGIIAIPKAGNYEHLQENFGATGWYLDPADVALISKMQ